MYRGNHSWSGALCVCLMLNVQHMPARHIEQITRASEPEKSTQQQLNHIKSSLTKRYSVATWGNDKHAHELNQTEPNRQTKNCLCTLQSTHKSLLCECVTFDFSHTQIIFHFCLSQCHIIFNVYTVQWTCKWLKCGNHFADVTICRRFSGRMKIVVRL